LPLVAVGLPIARTRRHNDFELGAAILLRDPEVLQLPPKYIVRETFNLTAAETEVALGMAANRSLKEIAVLRACSVNTVRTLASRVFQKTGCRRQSEVVRMLSALNEAFAAGAGLSSGLALASSVTADLASRSARSHYEALLQLPLHAPPNQHAKIVSRGFAPGDDTGYHLHGCGHEIVCVLEGSLTMEYLDRPRCETSAGEAIYVPPGLIHRGLNADKNSTLSLFHVGIGPAGSIDRRNL
jgi:DNA-binding CsgD family transcriptional regulator/quercetin dioxygenase-like cupin family protein